MKVIGIIPARFASTRFPGKMLHSLMGKSLIQRTYENTRRSPIFDELIIATDDQRIYDHVSEFGGDVVMTPLECLNGTERIAHVIREEKRFQQDCIIVNVQGDEPCINPIVTEKIVEALKEDPLAVMSTAVTKISERETALNPNEVKCVLDLQGYAIYFSRSLIPGGFVPDFKNDIDYYLHIGVYAYLPEFLLTYANLPPTPLQMAESLEQLKAVEHGYKIKTAIVECRNIGINTPEDITKVELELCRPNSSL